MIQLKVKSFLYRLRSNFLFLPALTAIGAILLAVITIGMDRTLLHGQGNEQWWLYSGGPDGARTVLSVIAGSMITITGVVFSITIVVLSLASQQFGPRLIRNFMTVKANQMVLGTFVATFIYGILVLRTVNATAESRFVPSLSVTVAIGLSLLSIAVLIYFIHSVSESIQAQNIIVRVRRELDHTVERIFPEKHDPDDTAVQEQSSRDYRIPMTCDREVCHVRADSSGYLQAVDNDALMQIAVEKDLLIHLGFRPGDFITRGSILVTVWPGRRVDNALSSNINAIFITGPERTLEQDVEFAISQLVEIAVRALSPGVNDPITAITCIDWLGAALCQLANRKLSPSHRYDKQHRLRIICKPVAFENVVNEAFDMIRQNAQSIPTVSIHLLDTITTVAVQAHRKKDRAALLRQAAMVFHGCKKRLSADSDREALEASYKAVVNTLDEKTVRITVDTSHAD